MKQVKLKCDPVGVLTISYELKQLGYIQGQDFDFAYTQSKWDDMIGEIPSHAYFTFYNEQLSTWFALTYL